MPGDVQDVGEHVATAAWLEHPLATEEAAVAADAKAAVRTVWAERSGGIIHRRREKVLRATRAAQGSLAFARALIKPHESPSIREMQRRVDVPLIYMR